jgi:hypothetical protein
LQKAKSATKKKKQIKAIIEVRKLWKGQGNNNFFGEIRFEK